MQSTLLSVEAWNRDEPILEFYIDEYRCTIFGSRDRYGYIYYTFKVKGPLITEPHYTYDVLRWYHHYRKRIASEQALKKYAWWCLCGYLNREIRHKEQQIRDLNKRADDIAIVLNKLWEMGKSGRLDSTLTG